MLLWVMSVKLVAEIALLALLGRWVLAAWLQRVSPRGMASNPFLWVLDVVARPFVTAASWLTPRRVPRHLLPVVAFALLLAVWLAATVAKIFWCVEAGMQVCQ